MRMAIVILFFCKWQELVRSNPTHWYAWEELHWTWTMDPYSPDTEVDPESLEE